MNRRVRGFVVIEIVIVLGLAAFLSAATWLFFSGASRQSEKLEARISSLQTRLQILEQLSSDAAQALEFEVPKDSDGRELHVRRLEGGPAGTIRKILYRVIAESRKLERDGLVVATLDQLGMSFASAENGAILVQLGEATSSVSAGAGSLILRPALSAARDVFETWQPAYDDRD